MISNYPTKKEIKKYLLHSDETAYQCMENQNWTVDKEIALVVAACPWISAKSIYFKRGDAILGEEVSQAFLKNKYGHSMFWHELKDHPDFALNEVDSSFWIHKELFSHVSVSSHNLRKVEELLGCPKVALNQKMYTKLFNDLTVRIINTKMGAPQCDSVLAKALERSDFKVSPTQIESLFSLFQKVPKSIGAFCSRHFDMEEERVNLILKQRDRSFNRARVEVIKSLSLTDNPKIEKVVLRHLTPELCEALFEKEDFIPTEDEMTKWKDRLSDNFGVVSKNNVWEKWGGVLENRRQQKELKEKYTPEVSKKKRAAL
jgi:hypothetical protein